MIVQPISSDRLMAEAVAAQLGAMGLQLLQAQVGLRMAESLRAAVESRADVAEKRLSGMKETVDRLISLKPAAGDLVFAIEALERAWCDAQPPLLQPRRQTASRGGPGRGA